MSQRGQVLVLVVLAIVVLLGFTAIAIDGSIWFTPTGALHGIP